MKFLRGLSACTLVAAVVCCGSAPPQDDVAGQAKNLVRKLGSDSISERDDAARALRELGPAALPILDSLSKDSDPEVAARIGRVQRAIRVRQDLTPRFREAVPTAEARLIDGSDEAWTPVFHEWEAKERERQWASTQDPSVRGDVVRELRSIYAGVSADFLISRLSFDPRLTDFAQAALSAVPHRVDVLTGRDLARMAALKDVGSRAFAIVSLPRVTSDRSAVIGFLDLDENVAIKHSCLAAMAEYRIPVAVKILEHYLDSTDPATSGTAAEALSLQDWEGARRLLKSRLGTRSLLVYVYRAYVAVRPPDPEVLQSARDTLSDAFPGDALHAIPLKTDLGRLVPDSWRAAADLVVGLRDPAGKRSLERLSSTLDPGDLMDQTPAQMELSILAAGSLARIGDRGALRRLSRVMDFDIAVRIWEANDFGDRHVALEPAYGAVLATLAQRNCEAVLDRSFKTAKALEAWLSKVLDTLRWDPERSVFRSD